MNQKKDNSNVAQDYISNIVRAYQNCLHISQQIKSAYENTLKTKKKNMKNYKGQQIESVYEKTLNTRKQNMKNHIRQQIESVIRKQKTYNTTRENLRTKIKGEIQQRMSFIKTS